MKARGNANFVGFVTYAAIGRLLDIDMPVKRNSGRFSVWMKGYEERLGVKVVATDGLSIYKPIMDGLGLEHQVCVTYVRKNAAWRLRKVLSLARTGVLSPF